MHRTQVVKQFLHRFASSSSSKYAALVIELVNISVKPGTDEIVGRFFFLISPKLRAPKEGVMVIDRGNTAYCLAIDAHNFFHNIGRQTDIWFTIGHFQFSKISSLFSIPKPRLLRIFLTVSWS